MNVTDARIPAAGRNPGCTLTAEDLLPHPALERLRSCPHRCRRRWHADPGWYTEDPGALDEVHATWANFSAWARAHFPAKPFLISETGGGAIFEWHNTSGAAGRAEGYMLRHGEARSTPISARAGRYSGAQPQ